jgi:dephospho-CoA kinase
LLFETGHQHDFERVVVCACDAGEQLRRIMARDRLDAGEARARVAAQWPISEKMKRADYVIMTDWTFAETEVQVRKVFEILRSQR